MRLYKHYFENTDTQSQKKYRTEWLHEKYGIFLRQKVIKIKLLGLFTIYKLTDKNREEIERQLQKMIQGDKKINHDDALVKMAKYIMNTAADYCADCCADYKACNARYDESHNALLPPEEHCIKNIIRFFEK